MKILKISGNNLASLAGPFNVDFEQEPLASSGLFAISGPTGAGKSTLLDALCLALYDATPRLLKASSRALPDVGKETVSAQDTRTLLRRGTAEGHAEVDFVGNDGVAYRARWSVRRSRTKAEGGLQPTAMSLHQLPTSQPIGATKTEVKFAILQRIGLSFDQFTRAVLLAQNEFSTFLKTEDNERGELLETLTGNTIYSDISIRAHERAKRESEVLRRMNQRLTDQKPLDSAERATIDAQSIAADSVVVALDQHRIALEQQWHWHREAEKLAKNEQLAEQALQASLIEHGIATPRRAALAQLEAVQAARPLANDVTRIDADFVQAQTVLTASGLDAEQARLRLEELTATLQRSAALLLQAENARHTAIPQLDRAKALDTRIQALRPSHQQAILACEMATRARDCAKICLQKKQNQQTHLVAAQESGNAWLARHHQWQTLAQSWVRWDWLLLQAGQAAVQADTLAQTLSSAQQNSLALGAIAASAATSLYTSAQAMQALEVQRQLALDALSAFDGDALQGRRREWQRCRDALSGAEKIWIELSGQQARHELLQGQVLPLRQAQDAAEATLTQELAKVDGIVAALAQAERSLKSAETACADHVETLRATLEDAAPCPVCGALEHPYHSDDGALRALLASLQAEVALCRQRAEKNIRHQASSRAIKAGCLAQMEAITYELDIVAQAIESILPIWKQHADRLALPVDAKCRVWLDEHIEVAQSGLQELERQEQALRRASAVRDQAQRTCDQAAGVHASRVADAAAAQAKLAQANAEQVALDDKRSTHALQLCGFLDELDNAFKRTDCIDPNWENDWKDVWRAAPARFYSERQAESRQWLEQRSAHDECGVALGKIDIELKAAVMVAAKAEQDAKMAQDAFVAMDGALNAMRGERQALWDGRAVCDIEAELQAALECAKTGLHEQQDAHRKAEQTCARLNEALAQAVLRRDALRAAVASAAAQLADWLQQQPECATQDIEQLRILLAVSSDVVRAERLALQTIDVSAASAATVLNERQMQRAQHQHYRPSGIEQTAQGLAVALSAQAAEHASAQDAASALRLNIAQDDARRDSAQGLRAEIRQQEEIEQRWARMNDLIGSADGKKFRNYAQQFTLEVLLGYANAHLKQLARRYQLERIDNPTNPSLGLMVRDQDMGGELRSVHSLSGGESFLVSLGLALGLASLSSNRVRVESLFIDEGFGSLDSDTLRVAMDALDGLQSMGRKVGVISHVQEMTERISTRIMVQPTAGGKSRVSVR